MSSVSRRVAGGLVIAAVLGVAGTVAARTYTPNDPWRAPLRVCADPNNMPFSNRQQQGFENRIASLIAADLRVPLEYDWRPQRRGFIRNTLGEGDCDVVMGVPTSYDLVLPTSAYYQSTYVFVTRTDRHLGIHSFDDTALRRLRIGLHMMGEDYENSPAATALQRRGLTSRIVPFMIYGDYTTDSPPRALITAVARGDVDVAVAWGPLAGYYAAHSPVPLTITPVSPRIDTPFLPFVYPIGMGVRHGDTTRRAMLDTELVRNAAAIRHVLDEYAVPRVGERAP
jgi:mxaJ protein